MREKKLAFFFLLYLPVSGLIFFNEVEAQAVLALNKKKSRQAGAKLSAEKTIPLIIQTERQTLFNALRQLNQTRGIYFLFSDKSFGDILVDPVVDYKQPVEQILHALLKNTDLSFKKIGTKTFIIRPLKDKSTGASSIEIANNDPEIVEEMQKTNSQQSGTTTRFIRGKVTTTDGVPLANVSVLIKGTAKGIVTNGNGEFDITGSPGDVLIFSFVGYEKKEIIIENDIPGFLTTKLSVVDKQMDEVIITSLGVRKSQRSVGYSASTITAEDLTASGNTNFASALYGKAAGVKISTAPGGATSAVQVQVRGLNSLNYNSQPLYVVDGIVIRNTNEKGIKGINNDSYWNDPRIRGNGILDINPADIETLTILKGASATALYGSEAASGVVVITTKKGNNKKGLGVEINYTNNIEQVAFLPKYQNVYGPGADRTTNLSEGTTEEGWIEVDFNNDGINESVRPNFRAYAQFGPKMEGQIVPWWDGEMRSYSPQPNNYKNLYRTGFNSILNAAVSHQSEKASYRFSYTRNDYKGIQVGGGLQRNTFNINSSFKINNQLSTDVVVSYINSKVHNRPYQLTRVIASYSGFFSRAEDMDLMFNKYKTSQGYKWVPWNQQQRNPAEALRYEMKNETLDLLWTQLRNSEDESQNRLLSSITLNYDVNKDIHIRGRIGTDYTNLNIEGKNYNEYPLAFNSVNSTGSYTVSDGRYSIFYGDVLFTYARKVNKNLDISFNGGYQARNEKYYDQVSNTSGGLIKENWFSLNNSFSSVIANANRSSILKYAFLGFFNAGYKNYLFLEGTARQEYSSTLPPGNNSYFYPSVNTSFVFSDAFKMPSFINFGKLRASYGIVGNAPPVYASGIAYTQTTLSTVNGPVASLSTQINAGNSDIRPENKYEAELGLEAKLFKSRLGIDLTYYNSRTIDQIIQLTVPASTGALSKLVNAGKLQSDGVELGLDLMAMKKKNFKWNARMNMAIGRTVVRQLDGAVKQIVYYEGEQNAIRIVAEEGKTVGNIYVHPRMTDLAGNYVIGSNGLYVIDNTKYVKVGNVMPKLTGGMANTFIYKNIAFNFMIDYRLGGQLVSPALKYNLGAGIYESTLQYRDEVHGGLPYYFNSAGEKILLNSHQSPAPNGSKVYHDGIILKGTTIGGKDNTMIVDAAYYYMNMFGWGPAALNEEGAVYNNSYIKMREAVISYTLPAKLANKMHFNSIRFSMIGRNLFYFWRTLKNLDPEATIGTNWTRQSIDDGTSAATRSYGFSVNLGF
ncbi:SusC/RagA family TonB-linked outer membrane protein [Terrimonas alba]|uniref:SusC/RagA family TonB-linked outer membrane protein n=1 Tax=Terrimonas alba TaxID=3349636 RepID=UPI0035F276C6